MNDLGADQQLPLRWRWHEIRRVGPGVLRLGKQVVKCTQSYTEFPQSFTEEASNGASREAHQYFSRATLSKLGVTLCAVDRLLLLPPPTRAVGQRHVGDHRLNPVTLRIQTAERSTK
jgi:hypothetical protein